MGRKSRCSRREHAIASLAIQFAAKSTAASFEVEHNASVLAPQLAEEFARKQLRNLISKVYEATGVGFPAASGGKFELGRRSKLFD